MSGAGQTYPPLPPGACDCHLHVFGDVSRYPVRHPKSLYQIEPRWMMQTIESLHRDLGFERYVAVQPTAYVKDHSFLIDQLSREPAGKARGVAIIDDSIDDATLERMHAAGVRGARFNFQSRFGLVPSFAEFHRSVDRIRHLGWFIKIFFMEELPAIEAEIRKANITTVVDHLGPKQDFARGIQQADFQRLLELIRGEGWWILLSNGHRRSAAGAPFDDMVAYGQALYEAAPDRSMWGTDWPHVTETRIVDERANLELLRRYLPDEEAWRRVLADNPARLFGFTD
ncbi:MAG: amidohydrolase family protein [Hyphomicrobiales bacterium]|nr:amidohydrolase family protein [Hyphomicrobiales bacterium]